MNTKKLGGYAFVAGVILAVLTGFISLDPTLVAEALVVLGVIVGLLNVSGKETNAFLMSTVALVIVSYFAGSGFSIVPVIGHQMQTILFNVMTFVAPGAIIVALKQIYGIAKD
ncbi:MAG: hypothetical protein KAI51_00045 [Candidatus Aenigmarchaeota archaeon]|nr:hypothetical protein [Candidatus Aenigmarchaeota archaeon]